MEDDFHKPGEDGFMLYAGEIVISLISACPGNPHRRSMCIVQLFRESELYGVDI